MLDDAASLTKATSIGHATKCPDIVDIEPITAVRQAEVTAAKTMITRTADASGLEPQRLAADTGYGLAEMLAWLVHDQGI